jgi:hypothetical protein
MPTTTAIQPIRVGENFYADTMSRIESMLNKHTRNEPAPLMRLGLSAEAVRAMLPQPRPKLIGHHYRERQSSQEMMDLCAGALAELGSATSMQVWEHIGRRSTQNHVQRTIMLLIDDGYPIIRTNKKLYVWAKSNQK